MDKNNHALRRWLPIALLLAASPVHAELRSFSIDQLKHTSSTLPNGAEPPALSSSTTPVDDSLPAAVPYNTLQMPPLPKPSKVKARPMAAMSASTTLTTTSTTTVVVSQTAPAAPKVINAATCRASLKYAAELALTTYQQHPDNRYMTLVAAATLADDNVGAGFLPNMAAFSRADDDLPWFFAPNHDALQQATTATELACTPPK